MIAMDTMEGPQKIVNIETGHTEKQKLDWNHTPSSYPVWGFGSKRCNGTP